MRLRSIVLSTLIAVATATVARAEGFGFRDASTGLWTDIAAKGDLFPGGSFFAGKTFAAIGTKAKASIAGYAGLSGCGPARSLVAFAAKAVTAAPPNTGIFMYDSLTGTITDVAIESLFNPVTGGTWDKFDTTKANPAITIDDGGPGSCYIHIYFRYKALGGPPATSDTGIFDMVLGSLPGIAPVGGAIRAQEGIGGGMTAPPSPFPAGAKFKEFDAKTTISAYSAATALGISIIAFPGVVATDSSLVPPVTTSNDTGIFVTSSLLASRTAVREGDATCGAPPWPGAGATYANFPVDTRLSIGAGVTPPGYTASLYSYLVFPAKSGAVSATDTALVVQASSLSLAAACGNNSSPPGPPIPPPYPAPFVAAAESGVTPVGGTYGGFGANTTQVAAHGSCGAAFEAPVVGLFASPAKSVIVGGTGACPTTAIATQKLPSGTLIAAAIVSSLPSDMSPAVNPTTFDVVYNAKPKDFGAGLFKSVGLAPGPLVTFLGSNPQVDKNGNMAARFP
ncbi:MAG: hypothetical protein HYR72_10410 [Deltaproteobacteria bacterium]|nr:hypothetical protein [Deltaproteobacteria bacterium]MBI3388113.1 hypothetical protein [Deltaproteobacteria bacterium]